MPGLATDPFSILLGARGSTQVTSQTNCLLSSQGARVIPSGRFPSDRFRPFGSRIEGTLMELSACFNRVLRLCASRNVPHFWHRKDHDVRSLRQVYNNGKCVSRKQSRPGEGIKRCAVCYFLTIMSSLGCYTGSYYINGLNGYQSLGLIPFGLIFSSSRLA